MSAVMKRDEIERELNESRLSSKLDDDLRFVDLLCDRWAQESYEGEGRRANALYRVIREREGAGSPGPPPDMSDNCLALDVILAHSDERYRALVVVWYKEGGSIAKKAERLGTNRTDLYGLWRRTLEYLKGRLHGEGIEV